MAVVITPQDAAIVLSGLQKLSGIVVAAMQAQPQIAMDNSIVQKMIDEGRFLPTLDEIAQLRQAGHLADETAEAAILAAEKRERGG